MILFRNIDNLSLSHLNGTLRSPPIFTSNARCKHGITFVRLGYMPSVTPERSNLPIVMVPMRTIPKILLKAASVHGPPVK